MAPRTDVVKRHDESNDDGAEEGEADAVREVRRKIPGKDQRRKRDLNHHGQRARNETGRDGGDEAGEMARSHHRQTPIKQNGRSPSRYHRPRNSTIFIVVPDAVLQTPEVAVFSKSCEQSRKA
jgi:hypothetical protein